MECWASRLNISTVYKWQNKNSFDRLQNAAHKVTINSFVLVIVTHSSSLWEAFKT